MVAMEWNGNQGTTPILGYKTASMARDKLHAMQRIKLSQDELLCLANRAHLLLPLRKQCQGP